MVIWYRVGSQYSCEGRFMFDTGHKKRHQTYLMNKGAV
jgi:hypothetical protein